MRLGIALCIVGLLLAGCASGNVTTPSGRGSSTTATSAEASIGADVPADDPGLQRVDAAGRSPVESVVALIDARNRSDWQAAYSLYAHQGVDFETAEREWIAAEESTKDFRVLEVRVVAADTAFVRVAYRCTTTPPGGAAHQVVVNEPGEWWPLYKVAGLWKTQWLPRQ